MDMEFGFNGNVNNYISSLIYKGTWDALNNVPFLQSGIGVGGEFYIVSTAGTTNLDGITDWQVGDWAIFVIDSPDRWQKVDNHDVQAYNTIQEEGTNLTQQSVLDFQGTGVTATNGLGKTIVTIPGNIPSTSYGLYAQTANGPSVTGIAEQSIIGAGVGTLLVPANVFSIGDSFTASLDGKISCVGTATLHIHVKTLSGVILADTGIIAMDAATSKSWLLTLYFTIRTLGVAGVASISSGGLFSYIKNSGTNFEGYVLSNINTTTFDTTVNNQLVVTVQFNTANAGNTIQSYNFTLQKVY
jgi:hypothetical protein